MIVRCSSLDKLLVCGGYASVSSGIDSSNKFTRCGTLAHLWLEDWVIAGYASAADRLWLKHVAEVTQGGTLELNEDTDVILSNLHLFAKWWKENKPQLSTKLHTEIELKRNYAQHNAELVGHADLVDVQRNKVVVYDWKYYADPSYLPPMEENLQLMAYAALAAEHFGVRQAAARIVLIKQREIWPLPGAEPVCDYDVIKVFEINDLLSKLVSISSRRQYELTHGPHCSRCLVRSHCPEYKKYEMILASELQPWDGSRITNELDVVRIAEGIKPAEDLVKAAKTAIKEWVNENGPVFNEKTGYEYKKFTANIKVIPKPADALIELYKLLAGKAYSAISISSRGINRVLRESGKTSDEIAAFTKEMQNLGIIGIAKQVRYGWRKRAKKIKGNPGK